MPCRRSLLSLLSLVLTLPVLAVAPAPAGAETEPPLLYEPRLYTPSVERTLVRAKADRLEARLRAAPPPPPVRAAPLLPRALVPAPASAIDRRMAARAQASIDRATASAAGELWRLERRAALADLEETELWALHALRTFRPDPAAGPEGR
ncbi:hypothetical protein [Caenispirillum salinarum]|uniref:hypothetical protein n=1 Tax=Caenispirillum salinarum TaxID=859058 RepID=UPI00384AF8B0